MSLKSEAKSQQPKHIPCYQVEDDPEVFVLPFPNDSVSIAASIILFPLMIEVVQMTMFLVATSQNIVSISKTLHANVVYVLF